MTQETRKRFGVYYTPEGVVRTLVHWSVRRTSDLLLDPACGDGRFLAEHAPSVGIEQDQAAAAAARSRAPSARIHDVDFFEWAIKTGDRFDCAAGNPPFIRYQSFAGEVRERALYICEKLGVRFPALASSWAPFLVVAASLLKRGGRMAFVVPAEIGHAPYAQPLLAYLARHFAAVHIIAIREKLFPHLSEDAWLLYAEGFGSTTDRFLLVPRERFAPEPHPPTKGVPVGVEEWRRWNSRLRAFLLSAAVRQLYQDVAARPSTASLGLVARVGIGYVTGANDFFHLRPSDAREAGIPARFLQPTVRNGRMLNGKTLKRETVKEWIRRDEPVLLLRLKQDEPLHGAVERYLNSSAAEEVQGTYKCRNRDPWYVVPDVRVPDAFLTYMSGSAAALVVNEARCVCTNSVHAVSLTGEMSMPRLQKAWAAPFTSLSCEIEGHPLGGGILKLEPREASRILLAQHTAVSPEEVVLINEGLEAMRRWRHHAG